MQLTPPDNFGLVETGIYRSSLFNSQHLNFLSTLSLRSVVHLAVDPLPRALHVFFEENNIELCLIPPALWPHSESNAFPTSPYETTSMSHALNTRRPLNETSALTSSMDAPFLSHLGSQPVLASRPAPTSVLTVEDRLKEALEWLLNVEHHPLLIYCDSGVHDTGMVVGCLRKLQRWNMTSIMCEYRLYAALKVRFMNEQMMELFDLDLVNLPKQLPQWLLNQIMHDQKEVEMQRGRC